jgi:penicillin G amidase
MRRAVVATLALLLLPLGAVLPSSAAAPAGHKPPGGITRDRFGIAHVHATSQHDLYFLQGWVHASDRLFQMDTSRRQASGTLGPPPWQATCRCAPSACVARRSGRWR